ncbi:MAG: hypothetical protein OEZ65_11430 [Gemmatimonadota bacterium]|nr:hypothetical protein [Gemmatimonadota bacterium]MDH5760191.1 hypothetical protein [Gemmatimonadota bacterium]
MKKVSKLVSGTALAMLTLAAVPRGVSATDCTQSYMLCVNSAVQLEAVYDEMASVECAAGWLGCTVGKLRFW